jgi:septal ring factor EnvC (AmiA/AmiB activator)
MDDINMKNKLNENQVKGQIASKESELGKLTTEHENMVRQFNEKVAANQKRHAELTGGIAALKALLA